MGFDAYHAERLQSLLRPATHWPLAKSFVAPDCLRRPVNSSPGTLLSELTTGQILEAREALEQAAATLLGKMLFEFSRLDLNAHEN